MQDWDIKPLGKTCTACGRGFGDSETYSTRLSHDAEGFKRTDFCEPCWAQESRKDPGYSNWKGVFHAPPPEPERKVRKETAESILRTLMAQSDESRREVIYILAVMLERQRVFVERQVDYQSDGKKTIAYEHRKTGETFLVPDPGLGLDRLEAVQREVMLLLAPDAVPPAPADVRAAEDPPGQSGSPPGEPEPDSALP